MKKLSLLVFVMCLVAGFAFAQGPVKAYDTMNAAVENCEEVRAAERTATKQG
ncbi:MAG: hypothetical protein GY765_43935 [bacterium]|nr:hypothetical protein [bacterium]